MKAIKILGAIVLAVVIAGMVLGAACTGRQGEQGPVGVGIDSIVNNGNGTFTINLTDGSSFTTDNLTGPQGVQGPIGQYPTPPASEVLYNENVSIDVGQEILLPMALKTGDRISVLLTAGVAASGIGAQLIGTDPLAAWSIPGEGDPDNDFYEWGQMEFAWIMPADASYSIQLWNSSGNTQTVTVYAKRYPSIQ